MSTSSPNKPLVIVVAVATNGVIGKAGQLPWKIPEDLKHFRRVTKGHAVIMGRKTWAEVGKPLPDRRNIVVSRNRSLVLQGAEVVGSLSEAIELARTSDDEPRVIGGAQIFEEAIPIATRVYFTEVAREVDGDTYFPAWDRSLFRLTERRQGEEPDVVFFTYDRP